MRESVKAICALVLIVAGVATVFAWFDDRPDANTWRFRVGSPIVGVLTALLLAKIHLRRDLVPDYLRQRGRRYFNRGGFCFSFECRAANGVCWLVAYFQNQYERPCLGRIALRPAVGFLRRAKIENIVFAVDCGPAAFGFVQLPVPLPDNVQGKRQSFEVGASVEYPDGRKKRLRFADGVLLRTDSVFHDGFTTAVAVAATLGGQVMLHRPATVTIDLPISVAEYVPEDVRPETATLWTLGDPPLNVR